MDFCFTTDSFGFFYLHAKNPLNIPLPVNVINFSGVRQGAVNLLSWQTIDEKEENYYEIERSYTGNDFYQYQEN